METITYHGCEYPVIIIDVPGWQDGARISVTTLNDELMNRDGSYVDDEGRVIDESIFFYVEEHEIDLPEEKLVRVILKHL